MSKERKTAPDGRDSLQSGGGETIISLSEFSIEPIRGQGQEARGKQ
jgi:hypothetical protein